VESGGTLRVEGNQVTGAWYSGILMRGGGKTVRGNVVSGAIHGIESAGTTVITGNVVTANSRGIYVSGAPTVLGNSVVGNGLGIYVVGPFTGTIARNDIFGNALSGLENTLATEILAPGNFWGAPTGPGLDPADPVTGPGPVNAVPFATKPFKVKVKIKP
jgi:parallel beta-helix repeat protein